MKSSKIRSSAGAIKSKAGIRKSVPITRRMRFKVRVTRVGEETGEENVS